ncbi:tRNA threonylcarbamoyladenosine dehydratase [Sulfoacidibacillus thermotolerans]|uniref:tRNA threonylcarbamoyladenosine dehydratase n=1 Tax=Sulfoacidibacillus thermotolerans TaxID=1765684 RepID=A0A2U3DCC8_SULT2|nr:tRNA threonylcarbamoyladenosine dehydratase [Sulfoacidibacillus thermotolerans]PWI58943.1 tRNA threonylcarbamoyladenosine dehydratase [Sulfoacidibacillus thermotolerans]
MVHRFARTELLIGTKGLARLRQATVAVFGLGGVGSYTAEALARSGIGRLVLIDKDVIDITNINRQIPALTSTIGEAKVDVMAKRINDINPDCEVIPKRMFFLKDTEDDIFSQPIDYVADAMDTLSAKIHLVQLCRSLHIPIASSMGAANKLDPTQFRIVDISETSVDPIARVMRRELRKVGITQGLKVVCSFETPSVTHEAIKQTLVPTDVGEGRTLTSKAANPPASLAFVPPVAGLMLASIIVRDLLDQP